MNSSINLNENIAEFNKRIFAYEDEKFAEVRRLIPMINTLQRKMDLPATDKILIDSLQNIMDAESQEEMNVFLTSFLESLEATKLKDVLDIDTCIQTFRKTADDLFYVTDIFTVEELQKRNSVESLINKPIHQAEMAQKKFNEEADKIRAEFMSEVDKNNQMLQASLSEEEKNRSKELIIKYRAGIKRIDNQKLQVERALNLIKEIPKITDPEERATLRANYAVALHQLHVLEPRTAYNHFVHQCENNVKAICNARSAYLKKEETGVIKSLGQAAFITTKAFVAPLASLASLPKEILDFGVEAASVGTEAGHKVSAAAMPTKLGERPQAKLPVISKTNFVKKAATFFLGVGGLALSALLCLSVVGIAQGVAVAYASVSALNLLLEGTDFITERKNEINRNRRVIKKLETLEEEHDHLHNQLRIQKELSKEKKMSVTNEGAKRSLESEAKIEMLLKGHKTTDILSHHEINDIIDAHQFKSVPEKPEPQEKKEAKTEENLKSELPPDDEDEDRDSEGFKRKF